MDVRKADPAFRRLAILLLVAGTGAGALLLSAFERYRETLASWVTADAGRTAQRMELLFAAFAVLLVAPLGAMAAYFSSLGRRTVRAQEFPPPGVRVIHDTPIISGHRAVSRGRWLQGTAVFLGASSVALCLLLWRLASLFS